MAWQTTHTAESAGKVVFVHAHVSTVLCKLENPDQGSRFDATPLPPFPAGTGNLSRSPGEQHRATVQGSAGLVRNRL